MTRLANGDCLDMENDFSDQLHVEVCQKLTSTAEREQLEHAVKLLILTHFDREGQLQFHDDVFLSEHIEEMNIWDSRGEVLPVDRTRVGMKEEKLVFHIYRLYSDLDEDEMLDCEDEELSAASHWQLPSRFFHNVWDTLIYDTDIKENLLNYAATTLMFSDHEVDSNLITWNRVILLHGPPGTAKTSLCRALAQKLAVRLSHRFQIASLLEINSHSLFSKWFSESGKLVFKMFRKVEELTEDSNHLVCLLIDEVESLTAARSSMSGGNEPTDALRVVNAVLTQIDRLKRFPNVLILTTSNVTGKIDLAFVDRADIKFFVGNPSPVAIYSIYKSCIDELVRVGIVRQTTKLATAVDLHLASGHGPSQQLWDIASKSVGLSGRLLRKMPFLAFAKFLHELGGCVGVGKFLDALRKTVDVQFKERETLGGACS